MDETLIQTRLHQLLRSPGGCALIVKAAASRLSPMEIVEPVTALHLIASAIGEITPWYEGHGWLVDKVRRDAERHTALANALIREPGIERWWAPLDREHQIWMEPETRAAFPAVDGFPTPARPTTDFEVYAQHPDPWVTTSTEVTGWTSQLAAIVSGTSDWHVNYVAKRQRIRVSPSASVYEIVSAEDWHTLVAAYGVRSASHRSPHKGSWIGQAWGPNDGLVPDWHAIARDWDGVHMTLWGCLTATQVRVTSEAGWSELWSWEAEQTTWLRWAFAGVDEMPPLDALPEGRRFPFPFQTD